MSREQRSKSKQIHPRVLMKKPMRENFLIFCEGRTEVGYFSAFRKKAKLISGGNALAIVQNAVAFKNASEKKYDQYWVVFDKDETPHQHFEGAIQLATDNGMRVAWSNQAFELWFILHYRDFHHACHRNQYETILSRYIPSYAAAEKGEEQGRKLYQLTLQHIPVAIDNARSGFNGFDAEVPLAHRESSTKIYELVESIQANLP
jgi:hypothetical protein